MLRCVTVCLVLIIASAVYSQTIPPGGTNVIPTDINQIIRANNTSGTMKIVSVTEQPFSEAIEVAVNSTPERPWNFQLRAATVAPVVKGDILLAVVYARVLQGSAETGEGTAGFAFEEAVSPHTKSKDEIFQIKSGSWQVYYFAFVSEANYAAGNAQFTIKCGYLEQKVQFGNIIILNYQKSINISELPRNSITWAGMEPDALWRTEANDRINEHRKGLLTLTVKDKAGKPVPDAQVKVTMKKHAFGFGSAVQLKLLADTTNNADKVRYQQMVEKLFNKVVVENELKWGSWENMANRQTTLDGLQWLKQRNIPVRGHCLIWPSWKHTPTDLPGLAGDPAALRKRINDHITEEVTTLKDLIAEWDVINEPYNNNDVMGILGDEEMVEWFKLANKAAPDIPMYSNDCSILSNGGFDKPHQDHYFKTIKFLKDNGAPIDGIGFQGHFTETPTVPDQLWRVLQRFDSLGLTMQVTEFDINSTDEVFKARYLVDFMTMLFSHPSVNGIVMWGFWEGRHWKPDAALFSKDWTLRPSGQAWIDLVTKTWWTDTTVTTGDNGTVSLRCFNGDYVVSVKKPQLSNDSSVTMTSAGLNLGFALDHATPANPASTIQTNSTHMWLVLPGKKRVGVVLPGGKIADLQVTLFSASGKAIWQGAADRNSLVDVSNLPAAHGVLFVRMVSGSMVQVRKIILAR